MGLLSHFVINYDRDHYQEFQSILAIKKIVAQTNTRDKQERGEKDFQHCESVEFIMLGNGFFDIPYTRHPCTNNDRI